MASIWIIFLLFPPSSGLSSSYSNGSAHQVGRHRVSGIPRDWILRQNVFISWRHLEVGKCCLRTHPVSSHQAQARLRNWWEDPAELHGCSFPGSARPGGQRGLIDAVLLHNEGPSPRKTAGVNFSTNYFFYTTSVWTKMEIQLHPEFRWYFFARIDNSKKQFGQNSFPPSLPVAVVCIDAMKSWEKVDYLFNQTGDFNDEYTLMRSQCNQSH